MERWWVFVWVWVSVCACTGAHCPCTILPVFVCVRARVRRGVRVERFSSAARARVPKWVSECTCVSKIINRPQKRVIPPLCCPGELRGSRGGAEMLISSHIRPAGALFLFIRAKHPLLGARCLCYLPTTCLAGLKTLRTGPRMDAHSQSTSTCYLHHPLTPPPVDRRPAGQPADLFQRNS